MGAEDVVVDAAGCIVTGVEDGRILRIHPGSARVDLVARTGGRPLGLELLPDGHLLVCDAIRGLLRVDPGAGHVQTLVAAGKDAPLKLCNNAAVARDGSVYFSDSSQRFPLAHWRGDLYEHSGTGRLYRFRAGAGLELLLDGLQFANGVALAPDESFVVVAETGAYRLTRLWLRGPRSGQRETFIDGLPGFPDNASTGSDGLLWIALPSPRNALLDFLHARHPLLRRLIWALPAALQPPPERCVWVIGVDADGRVIRDVQLRSPEMHMITGVRERDGRLYLGSLAESAVAILQTK